jgi:hypothetical protein
MQKQAFHKSNKHNNEMYYCVLYFYSIVPNSFYFNKETQNPHITACLKGKVIPNYQHPADEQTYGICHSLSTGTHIQYYPHSDQRSTMQYLTQLLVHKTTNNHMLFCNAPPAHFLYVNTTVDHLWYISRQHRDTTSLQ